MGKYHEFSTEKLYHFVCGDCKNWWSYAHDGYFNMIAVPVEQFCPHCGVKKNIVKKVTGENPRWERDVT